MKLTEKLKMHFNIISQKSETNLNCHVNTEENYGIMICIVVLIIAMLNYTYSLYLSLIHQEDEYTVEN